MQGNSVECGFCTEIFRSKAFKNASLNFTLQNWHSSPFFLLMQNLYYEIWCICKIFLKWFLPFKNRASGWTQNFLQCFHCKIFKQNDLFQGRRNICGQVDLSTPYFEKKPWKCPIFLNVKPWKCFTFEFCPHQV